MTCLTSIHNLKIFNGKPMVRLLDSPRNYRDSVIHKDEARPGLGSQGLTDVIIYWSVLLPISNVRIKDAAQNLLPARIAYDGFESTIRNKSKKCLSYTGY